MTVLVNILFLSSFYFAFIVSVIYFVHMFQLNSYKMKVQIVWLKKHFFKSILVRLIFSLIVAALIYFLHLKGMAISSLLFIFAGLLSLPKEAKKPLVFTMRVIRLIATIAILATVATLICYFVNAPVIVLSLYCFSYLVILLANIINRPMELAVNRYYINDAKKMINSMPALKVIGVTGSYGKTSVKFYLNKLLSAKFNVLITPESYNTTLGVVKTIRTSLRATHEIFVCEMGAKNIGHIKEICDIVNPDFAVITSIGPQHLESFKTIERVIQGKFELVEAIDKENGVAFLNYDNEYIRGRKTDKKVISYGLEKENNPNFLASEIKTSRDGSEFTVKYNGIVTEFSTKLIGTNNVQNIIGAIAVAVYMGVSISDLQIQVRRLENVPHRLQLIKGNNAVIIDDAYNSNPTGAKAALDTLAQFDGVKILVTPGMIELGSVEDECNRTFGQQASKVCDYVVLVGEKQTKFIYQGLISQNYAVDQIYVASCLQDALKYVEKINSQGKEKVVLLENDLPDNY